MSNEIGPQTSGSESAAWDRTASESNAHGRISGSSILPGARQVAIDGGTLSVYQDSQINIFNYHHSDAYHHNVTTNSSTEHEAPGGIQPPISLHEGPQQPQRRRSLPVQRSYDIYYQHMIVKKYGYPLWIPSPNTHLPLQYRREGISICDVGILTDDGGFDYLFNICLPRDHPNNPDDLPDEFAPLMLPLARHTRGYFQFGENSTLVSSSIHSSNGINSSSTLTFESSATSKDGAILVMPHGTKSEDLRNVQAVRKYTADNAERWYRYATDVLGLDIKNGDLRLVTGSDHSIAWGMATFVTLGSTLQSTFRMRFQPNTDTADDNDSRCTSYSWEYESGIAEGRTGPGSLEVKELWAGDEGERGNIYRNQCLFLRTSNITLAESTWNKLLSENYAQSVIPDPPKSPISTATEPQTGIPHPPANDLLGPSPSTGHIHSAYTGSSSSLTPNLTTVSAIHPSKVINESLLKDNADARIVITQDEDWISVLKSDDTVMPSGQELYERILATRVIQV